MLLFDKTKQKPNPIFTGLMIEHDLEKEGGDRR